MTGEGKRLPFSLVEMFPQVRGKQAADSGVSKEQVKVPQQAAFGFIRFVLLLQGTVWDDLLQIQAHIMSTARIQRRRKEFWLPDWKFHHKLSHHYSPLHFNMLKECIRCLDCGVPLRCFGLHSPAAASCRTSVSVLTTSWARLWQRGKPRLCLCAGHGAGDWQWGETSVSGSGDSRYDFITGRAWSQLRDSVLHTHMRMVWAPLGILHRVKSRLIWCESSSNRDSEADFVFRKACKAWTAFFTWNRHGVSSSKTLFWHAEKNFFIHRFSDSDWIQKLALLLN